MAANEVRITINATDKASATLEGIGTKLGGLAKTAGVLAGVLGGAAVGVGAATLKLAKDAVPLAGVQAAFDGLTEAAGVNSDEMLESLQQSSAGMVTNSELMTSFNKAAQLVSQDFAVQLPDAMQYLSKVAAATGQDMGFMLDSLVTGVGRMSPMILDNLGIQVQLSEVTARAAEMFGVQAEELDKSQQQAALMAIVLEKLQTNTAAMPELTENAGSAMTQFSTQLENLGDAIGLSVLPALEPLVEMLTNLVTEYAPPLIEFFTTFAGMMSDNIPVAVDVAAEAIGRLKTLFDEIRQIFAAGGVGGLLEAFDLEKLQPIFDAFEKGIGGFVDALAPIKDSFAEFAAGMEESAPGLLDLLKSLGEIFGTLLGAVALFVANALPQLGQILAFFVDVSLDAIQAVVEVLAGLGEVLQGILTGDLEKVQEGLRGIFGALAEFATDVLAAAINLIALAIDNLASKLQMLGGVPAGIATVLSDIADAISTLGAAIENFDLSKLSEIGTQIGLGGQSAIEQAATGPGPEGGGGGLFSGLFGGGFQHGGVVPGPLGAPRMVMAHAGETILPTHRPGMQGPQIIQLVVDGRVLAEVVNGIQGRDARQTSRLGARARM